MRNRDNINNIIDYINESRIQEAKQAIHIVRFTTDQAKDGQMVCNSRVYNKLKAEKGYKEIDHYQLDENDNPKRYYNTIMDYIKSYGLDPDGFKPDENGFVTGSYGHIGFGYQLFRSSDIKVK